MRYTISALQLLLTVALLSTSFMTPTLQAQAPYQTAVGLRAGTVFGVSVKHFVSGDFALEGHLVSKEGEVEMAALGMAHKQLAGARGLAYYYGAGTHIWFGESVLINEARYSDTRWGVDFVIGAEYTLWNTPVSLAMDYKPQLHFTGQERFDFLQGAVSLRYVIR